MHTLTKLRFPSTFLLILLQASILSAQNGQSSTPKPGSGLSFYKTSFDCTKTKDYSVEQAICKNDELARLDLEMSAIYRKRLQSGARSEKRELVQSQQKWLTIRNSYNVNPFHGDPDGTLADLSDFYQNRIAALRADRVTLGKTKLLQEYDWLESIAPEGFSKGFSIGRGYLSCENPCEEKPSLYKLLSIGGNGVGKGPGDIDTPFAKLVGKLTSDGWAKCRAATDDSGKLKMDYLRKNANMIAVSRYYSMGVGNGIGLSITTSGPLPEKPARLPANPPVTTTSNWVTYSSPDVGLKLQYPPNWWIRDDSVPYERAQRRTKYLTFGAKDYTGNFRITMEPVDPSHPGPIVHDNDDPEPKCFPSSYQISGLPGRACLLQYEVVGDETCTRYLESVEVQTSKYHFSFDPPIGGSFPEDSNHYKLTDLYEKILSTITLEQ